MESPKSIITTSSLDLEKQNDLELSNTSINVVDVSKLEDGVERNGKVSFFFFLFFSWLLLCFDELISSLNVLLFIVMESCIMVRFLWC